MGKAEVLDEVDFFENQAYSRLDMSAQARFESLSRDKDGEIIQPITFLRMQTGKGGTLKKVKPSRVSYTVAQLNEMLEKGTCPKGLSPSQLERRVAFLSSEEVRENVQPVKKQRGPKMEPGLPVEPEHFFSGGANPSVHLIFNQKAFRTDLPPNSFVCLYVKDEHPTGNLSLNTVHTHIKYLTRAVMPAFKDATHQPRFVLVFPEKSKPERYAQALSEARKKYQISHLVVPKFQAAPTHINTRDCNSKLPPAPRATGDYQKITTALRRHLVRTKMAI